MIRDCFGGGIIEVVHGGKYHRTYRLAAAFVVAGSFSFWPIGN